MKFILFFLLVLACSVVTAQPPVIKKTSVSNSKLKDTKVTTKKVVTPSTQKSNAGNKVLTSSFRPSSRYQINPALVGILAGYTSKTTLVNGRKITSRMVPVNGTGLVNYATPKNPGITQKTKETGSTNSNGEYCQSFSVKVSANSENFDVPYGTQASHIYPGAAYLYDEYYKNTVSPRTLTLERNPIYIQASSSSGNGHYELVENPTEVSLNAAVGRIKSSLPSTATNESTSINMVSLYDEADFFLKVNGGGGGFGFKADASFGIGNSSKKSYFLIDATQTFFTLNAITPEGSNTGFFKDPANDKTNGALFMASVSYGRRVLGVLETEFKDEKMMASFKASYSSGFAGGYAGLDMINGMSSQSTKVKLYVVGGTATTIEVPNATEAAVRDAINNFLRTTTTQNAVPIKFTFRNMAMSGMRYESATDNFTYQQCVPVTPELKYNVRVNLMMIENSKQEEVKFGLVERVTMYSFEKIKFADNDKDYNPLLAWGEFVDAFHLIYRGEEPPRNFTRSTTVNRSCGYQLSQTEILNGAARLELRTEYIAMYATKVFGKTNEDFINKTEKVYLRDVITSGGGSMNKDIQVNFNGRVFTIRFTISATPA